MNYPEPAEFHSILLQHVRSSVSWNTITRAAFVLAAMALRLNQCGGGKIKGILRRE